MEVANKYGMLQGESDTAAVRAVFFVDPEGIMRTILYYPASLGRNFNESSVSSLDCRSPTPKASLSLPTGHPGRDVIVPPPPTTDAIKKRIEEVKGKEEYNQLDWYLTFKKDQ